jgi:phytoene dehydrogenase-like protein
MSTDNKTTVAIIGAGIAGLSTGCFLQMNGYAAHIYEMHTKPGGLCTSWDRKGYTIDGCIHWLTGSRPGVSLYKLWQEIGLIQGLKLIDHDEFSRVEFPDGTAVTIYCDPDRLEAHLLEIAPEDAAAIKEFTGAIRRLARTELPSDLPPQELMRLGDFLRMMPGMLSFMRMFRKWDVMTIDQWVARFKNRYVRVALSQIWLPEMSAFIVPTTLAWFHGRQAGYPLGGSLPMMRAVEKRFLDLGGSIDYGATVTEILVQDDRAVGVRLADGKEQRFDVVISAADLHATVSGMLAGKYGADELRAWSDRLVPFPPLVFIGIGVSREFPDEPVLASGVSMGLEEPLQVGEQTLSRLDYHLYNYDPSLSPAGKTVITCMLPADYDYWRELARDRKAYEAQKKAIGDQVVKALDRRFPGLAAQVEMVDVSTPTTFERYTGNWRGSFEGWMPTPSTLSMQMPKTLPGLDSFYLAGQWVAPGGGLPAGVMTGRQVVQLLCHRDRRKFRTTLP